jgi:hypothetical protein
VYGEPEGVPRSATVAAVTEPVTIDSVTVADEPEAWTTAGFTVDDDGTCRVGHVRIRLVGREHGKRIVGWALRGLTPGAPLDGLPTTSSTEDPCEPAQHANGAVLIDHLVLLTPDHPRTLAAFDSIGLPPRRTRETDQYGPPFLQTFFRAGEVIVELIGPAEATGTDPATFFGLAYTVKDLDVTARLLGAHLGRVKDAVQPGRQIATLRHKEVDMSVATAFMSPGVDALGAINQRASP